VTPEIAPYVSAVSVMLAAYGFFYNAYKARVEEGQEVGTASSDLDTWKAQVGKVAKARTAARLLAVVPILVWLLLLPKIVEQLKNGADVGFALDRYSTLDVLFVVVANVWLVIALAVGAQARALSKTKSELEAAKP
jgi:hypothetical protein